MSILVRPEELRAASTSVRDHAEPLRDAADVAAGVRLLDAPGTHVGTVSLRETIYAAAAVAASAVAYLADSAIAAAESFEQGDQMLADQLEAATTFESPQ